MKKIFLLYIAPAVFVAAGAYFVVWGFQQYQDWSRSRHAEAAIKAEQKAQNWVIDNLLDSRRAAMDAASDSDLFGQDGIVKILLLGVDKRVGQTSGHCDAIQLITVDQKKQEVTITAVPRGTYSPLPPGMGATSSDYYVSNACGLGGLEYGIKQIEKILGQKEDYLVVVGFSETLGILRSLKLPTTDTLRWLRHRQGYAIGEPQRAHNHSTFLKQLLLQFVPKKNSPLDKAWQYIIYKMVKTDLTFAETQKLVDVLSVMNLPNQPERIKLLMRPAYNVQDIPYSSEHLGEYLDKMLNPIKNLLNKKDYSGTDEKVVEADLLKAIGEKINDPEFVSWAFDNGLWLQINDDKKRLAVQYDLLEKFSSLIATSSEREAVIGDYILEMDSYGEGFWADKGKKLLLMPSGRPKNQN
jgi:hypothetical protein